MREDRTWRTAGVLIVLLGAMGASRAAAQVPEKITCAPGRIYRDIRHVNDLGREQYCELDLPGRLVVKDGPYRSWLNPDAEPTRGNYLLGRAVGKWTDCNRFNRCSSITYEAPFPEEQQRKTYRPEIPIRYEQGKYSFDFASCRSTWITHVGGSEAVLLNIGGGSPYRCVISRLPQHVLEHGGEGSYTCFIPYSVGTRSFASLDLLTEFPKAGLPQFCRPERRTVEPLMIREGIYDVAYSMDVQCASFRHAPDGNVELTIQLNPIVADLAAKTAEVRGTLNTLLCFDSLEGPKIVHDGYGTTFLLKLSGEKAKAGRQEKCILENLPISHRCAVSAPKKSPL